MFLWINMCLIRWLILKVTLHSEGSMYKYLTSLKLMYEMLSSSMKFYLAVLSSSRMPMLAAEGGATAQKLGFKRKLKFNCIHGTMRIFWPLVGLNVIINIWIVECWPNVFFARSRGGELES